MNIYVQSQSKKKSLDTPSNTDFNHPFETGTIVLNELQKKTVEYSSIVKSDIINIFLNRIYILHL